MSVQKLALLLPSVPVPVLIVTYLLHISLNSLFLSILTFDAYIVCAFEETSLNKLGDRRLGEL